MRFRTPQSYSPAEVAVIRRVYLAANDELQLVDEEALSELADIVLALFEDARDADPEALTKAAVEQYRAGDPDPLA